MGWLLGLSISSIKVLDLIDGLYEVSAQQQQKFLPASNARINKVAAAGGCGREGVGVLGE